MQIHHESQGISVIEWPDDTMSVVIGHDIPTETATRVWREAVPSGWSVMESWIDPDELQDHYVLRKADQ